MASSRNNINSAYDVSIWKKNVTYAVKPPKMLKTNSKKIVTYMTYGRPINSIRLSR